MSGAIFLQRTKLINNLENRNAGNGPSGLFRCIREKAVVPCYATAVIFSRYGSRINYLEAAGYSRHWTKTSISRVR